MDTPTARLALALLTASGAALVAGSACAGSVAPAVRNDEPAAPATPRAELAHEDDAMLVQPALAWRGAEATEQGTAFFVAYGGRAFAVTSAHYLDRSGPTLEAIALLPVRGPASAEVARASESWGAVGHGGVDAVDDYREDYLILPLAAAPSGYALLELEAAPVHVGERVWLPNKDDTAPHGHRAVLGTVTDSDVGYVDVELDGAVELTSQSGSPLLSASTGKVVGVLSRGEHDAGGPGRVVLSLTPARAVLAALAAGSTAMPLSAQVPGASSPPAPARVAFRFAWPAALRATLRSRRLKETTGKPAQNTGSAWRLTTASEGDDLLLHYVALDAPPGRDPRETVMPSRRVSKTGELLRLEGTAPLLEFVKEQMAAQKDPRAAALLQDMFSEQALLARARNEWAVAVGQWIGGEFEPGASYGVDGEAAMPMFGGLTVKTQEVFTVTANVPCDLGDASRRCAQIDARSYVDRRDMQRVVQRFLDQVVPADKRNQVPVFKELHVRTRKRIVTDPATLVPHSVRIEHYTIVALEDAEHGLQRTMTYELRDDHYEYASAYAPP